MHQPSDDERSFRHIVYCWFDDQRQIGAPRGYAAFREWMLSRTNFAIVFQRSEPMAEEWFEREVERISLER